MRNSYIIIGAIILLVVLFFVFNSKKTEAPVENTENTAQVTSINSGEYKLDTEKSSLGWRGEFVTGMSEEGTVKLSSGSVLVEEGVIKSGEFTIDMDTIVSTPLKEKLVTHLKSDDFFSVNKYPTAKFVLKSFAPSSNEGVKVGRYVISGNLTVRGVEKPISFMATVLPTEDGGLSATGSFAINRADWEVKYNSSSFFTNLGDKIIRDAVEITLDLKAQKVIQ